MIEIIKDITLIIVSILGIILGSWKLAKKIQTLVENTREKRNAEPLASFSKISSRSIFWLVGTVSYGCLLGVVIYFFLFEQLDKYFVMVISINISILVGLIVFNRALSFFIKALRFMFLDEK